MGRIKTAPIKSITRKLLQEHKSKLKTDFKENKAIVESLLEVPSKPIRNKIAGYVTRIMKKEQEPRPRPRIPRESREGGERA